MVGLVINADFRILDPELWPATTAFAPSLNLYSSPFPGEFSFLSVLLKYLLPLSFEITWTLQKKNFKARWKILCLFRHQSVFRQNSHLKDFLFCFHPCLPVISAIFLL